MEGLPTLDTDRKLRLRHPFLLTSCLLPSSSLHVAEHQKSMDSLQSPINCFGLCWEKICINILETYNAAQLLQSSFANIYKKRERSRFA